MLSLTENAPLTASTIGEALLRSAEVYGELPRIVCGAECWPLARLVAEAGRVQAWLEDIVAPREAVLFVPRNTPASVAFVVGAIGSGRVPVLADPAWTAAELEALMERNAIVAAAWDGPVPEQITGRREAAGEFEAAIQAREPRACAPGIACGRFSSGTTGTARCLGFTQSAVLAAARGWGSASGYGPEDRVLCLATLNNGLAFNAALFAVLLSGAQLIFHPGRLLPRAIARTMRATEPTVLVAFPFVYGQLTANDVADKSLSRLRLAVSSAARLEPAVKETWTRKAQAPVCDYYGLVEVGPCTFNDGSDTYSVGHVLPGVSIAVTDDDGRALSAEQTGRIRVRTESMADDFLDGDEPRLGADIDDSGYYVTRDVGQLDESGRLQLTGRVGRQINIEGRKIEPSEVEEVLRAIPGVRDAVVVAEQSATRTQLAAYVEASDMKRSQIARFCGERLASYKIPQRIEILERLPRSSSGKPSIGRLGSAAQTEVRQ